MLEWFQEVCVESCSDIDIDLARRAALDRADERRHGAPAWSERG